MPTTIADDIPCVECGYDLRGLDPAGKCPECGSVVRESINEWEGKYSVPDILHCDPRWVRDVMEGMVTSCLTFVFILLLAIVSRWMFAWRSPQRRWALGIACTIWVLSWFSVWKLTAPSRRHDHLRDGTRKTLRISATLYLAFPLLTQLPRPYLDYVGIPLGLTLMLAGAVAVFTWFIYASQVASRCICAIAGLEFDVLAFIHAVVFFSVLLPTGHGSADSLSVLLGLNSIQFAAPSWPIDVIREFTSLSRPNVIVAAVVIVPIWSATVCVRLALTLIAARRAQKTAANSRP